MTPTFQKCDGYLEGRTGTYDYRCRRYDAVIDVIMASEWGLRDTDTVADLGAGWTEFGHRLSERGFRGRYIPYDGAIDGKDLTYWQPPFATLDWIVAIELLEHLHNAEQLVKTMLTKAEKGVVITTPNSMFVDTIAMDDDHVNPMFPKELQEMGLEVELRTLFPGTPYLLDPEFPQDTILAYSIFRRK